MIRLDRIKIKEIIAEKFKVPYENVSLEYDEDEMYGLNEIWAEVKTVWESQWEENEE